MSGERRNLEAGNLSGAFPAFDSQLVSLLSDGRDFLFQAQPMHLRPLSKYRRQLTGTSCGHAAIFIGFAFIYA